MKWLLSFCILFCSVGIVYTLLVFCLILSGTKESPKTDPDTILILGAKVTGASKDKAYPSTILRERLDTAILYIKKYPQATIIVCGGKGTDEPDSEANVMADYLAEHGITHNNILLEDTSTNTKENIANAQKKKNLGATVIITSDYHMYRSLLIANRLHVKIVSGLPAPSSSSAKIKTYIREIASLGYALLFIYG